MNATTTAPATIADALARYEAALAAHSRDWSSVHPACLCGFSGKSRNAASAARGVGLHIAAAHKRADRECETATAAIRATPEGRDEVAALYADAVREQTTRAYVAPTVESVEPVANVLHIAPEEFSEGGTCTTCELPSHTTCPLVTGCECCEANAEEQIAEDATEPEFVKVQTTDGYGTPHMVLRRADLVAAGRAANQSEDVNENATEEQHLAMLEEEYDALREEQDGNTPGTPRAAWVADRLNVLARAMSESAYRLEQARRATDEVVVTEYPLLGDDSVTVQHLAPAITSREALIARMIARDVSPERAAMIADARDALQAELTRTAPAIAAVLEQDLPPTAEQRYEVAGDTTAADLRPGDYVVDHEGARQYAAFDVDPSVPGDSQTVLVWTAIADQERGLPPVLRLPADLRVRITRVAAHA